MMPRGGDARRPILAAAVCVWALTGAPLHAQQLGNAVDGRRLATEWCSACHLVEPDSKRGASDLAPSFIELADDPSTTDFRLRAFLMTPHQRMPDFKLSRDQTDDLIAYILSLRRR